MDATTQTIINTAESTLAAAAPALIAAAVGSNPGAAVAVSSAAALAPIAIQFLQNAVQLQNVGLMTPDQLAATFAIIAQQINVTHNAWAALNTAQAAPVTAPVAPHAAPAAV